MKKQKIIRIALIVAGVMLIGGVLLYVLPLPIFVINPGQGAIDYQYGDVNIYEELSADETAQLAEIVNGKTTFYDSPSCGFDDHIAFIVGGKRFSVACDTCPTIKYHGKYIHVSDSEIETVHRIMEAHGANFPCV